MMLEVNGSNVETDVQGFLQHLNQWSEEFASEQAKEMALNFLTTTGN